MSRFLLGISIVCTWYALSPSPQDSHEQPIIVAASIDTVTINADTVELVAPEDQLLHDVGLTFDFLGDRIGSDMFWDAQGNLVIKGDKEDTIWLSKSCTIDHEPRMITMKHETKEAFSPTIVPTGDYIEDYASIAVNLMNQSGIPASIKLAQAIHESGWGKGGPAQWNNHFGIKCQGQNHHKFRDGSRIGEQLHHCRNFHDDDGDDMFKIYGSVKESFVDHNRLLLLSRPGKPGNYRHIWEIPKNQKVKRTFKKKKGAFYKKPLEDGKTYTYPYWIWMAIELQNEGYATDTKYAQKIIRTIKKYKLYAYDQDTC